MRDFLGLPPPTRLQGINQALSPDHHFLVGNDVTLADICFVAEWSLFFNERMRAGELQKRGREPILHEGAEADFPPAVARFSKLSKHPAFVPDVEPYLKKLQAGSVSSR